MKKIEFLEKARDTHGYKYKYLNLSDKITLRDKINIEYDGEFYEQTVSKHLMGRCPEKSIAKKTTTDFIKESKLIWGDKYDYSITEYTGALNTIKIIYDGVVYEQRAKSHIEGMSPEFRKTDESRLKDIIRDGNELGKNEIESFLKKYKLDYTRRYQVSEIEFDFYLTSNRTCIEFDGRHHFEPIDEFGGLETLNKIREIDRIKENYCEDKYINLIRIKYDQFDDIYQILWSNLRNYIKTKKTH
jgi:hypothetical protein